MMKVTAPSLQQLVSRLHAQALKIATLRSALDVQFSRITRRQAELDVLAAWPADGGKHFGVRLARPLSHPSFVGRIARDQRLPLRGAMNHKVGIWIDHKKAVIVSASPDRITTRTLESEIGPHARYSSQTGSATPDGPHTCGGEKRYEERYSQHLDRYYDEVISQLGQPEALLIFGPGEAKLQLKERFSRSKALAERVVGVETTDKLTEPQIVAKVKEHYGINR